MISSSSSSIYIYIYIYKLPFQNQYSICFFLPKMDSSIKIKKRIVARTTINNDFMNHSMGYPNKYSWSKQLQDKNCRAPRAPSKRIEWKSPDLNCFESMTWLIITRTSLSNQTWIINNWKHDWLQHDSFIFPQEKKKKKDLKINLFNPTYIYPSLNFTSWGKFILQHKHTVLERNIYLIDPIQPLNES
jgi:hypothetical protein